MPHLVFIRHSQSRPEPGIPARQWGLTGEGIQRCGPLAEALRPYGLDRIITSTERKAVETGAHASQFLGADIPCLAVDGLHEHERENVPFFEDIADFTAAVRLFFSKPHEQVFGDETARAALERFSTTVSRVCAAYPRDHIGIVTHGTVLSLFVSQYAAGQHPGMDVFQLWKALGMPAIVAFSHPEVNYLGAITEIK